MIKFGAEVAPYGNAVSWPPPGSQSQADHVKCAHDRGWPHRKSQQQTNPDTELDGADQVSEKYRVRQHQISEDGLIEAYRAVLGIALQILLKTAVGEFRAKQFILAEQ